MAELPKKEEQVGPPAWVHDGRQVWYLPHQANDTKYAGTVRGEPTLLGRTTWCVRLIGMDDAYEKLHPGRRTVGAAACDSLRPRAVSEHQEMFEKFLHELVALALQTGVEIGASHGGVPADANYRAIWEKWAASLSDPTTERTRNYWIEEAYKFMRAGGGAWKKSG